MLVFVRLAPKQSQAGQKPMAKLEDAGASVNGACCQQQELLVFRGPWRHSDSHKPQACIKQKPETQTASQALQFVPCGTGIG